MPKKKKKKGNPIAAMAYLLFMTACFFFLFSNAFLPAWTAANGAQEDLEEVVSNEPEIEEEDVREVHSWNKYDENGEEKTVILLDPGHGGIDGGNVGADGTLEKDVNLAISLKLAAALEELNPNLIVYLTRTTDEAEWFTDVDTDLQYRTDMQDAVGADYFFSLHGNSYGPDPTIGGYCFYINEGDTVMEAFANRMIQDLEAIGYSSHFGTKTTEELALYVVANSNIHSMLIEMGFMTNPDDLACLKDEYWQQEIASALAAAISDMIMENPDFPTWAEMQAVPAEEEQTEWTDF